MRLFDLGDNRSEQLSLLAFQQLQAQGFPPFSLGVATSTVIASRADDPYLVCVLEHAQKHNGRITLPGGKRTGSASHLPCALDEFDQEVGGNGASIRSVELFAIKADPLADVRKVTLAKATDKLCPDHLAAVEVTALYGYPDYIYTAKVDGDPAPKDGEAKSVSWFDVRDLKIEAVPERSIFGAQHDLILYVYKLALQGRAACNADFASMLSLRQSITAC